MARYTVVSCDFCKLDKSEKDNPQANHAVSVSIGNRAFDSCGACAAKLIQCLDAKTPVIVEKQPYPNT